MKINLARYALDNKAIVWFFLVLLTAGGIVAFNDLPKKEDAPFVVKQAVLVCQYPGATADEVERSVTTVIEREVQAMPNIYKIKGESHPGFSYITVELLPGTDPAAMSQMWDELRKKVYNVQPKLPQGAGEIVVNDDFGDVYGIYFALTGDDGVSYSELRDKAQQIKTLLNPLDGVSKISLFAEQTEVIDVFVSPSQLSAHGIPPDAIMAALQAENRLVAAGTKNSGQLSVTVIAGGVYDAVDDIRSQLIPAPGGELVALGQIARVERGYYEPAQVLMRVGGLKAIGIAIATSQDKDVVKAGNLIRRTLQTQVTPQLPYGFELEEIYPEDTIARQANKDFFVNLAISVATVILLLLFFYKIRATVLIGTALIFSIAATLFTMQFMGTGLNRSSLAAFTIAMGMLVDNAIVVTDNARSDIRQGMKRRAALIDGATRPMWGLLGATVIGIVSFLPIYLADSAAAEIVHPLFIVLTLSLGFSWILSQTQTPVFGDLLLNENKHGVTDPYDTKAYHWFGRVLNRLIRYRWLTLGSITALLIVSVVILRRMPSDFFPYLDKPYFRADLFLPEGYGIDATSARVSAIEEHLAGLPGVKKVSSAIGSSHPRYYLASTSYSLKPNFANMLIEVESHKQTVAAEQEFYDYVTSNHPDIVCRSSRFKLASPADGAVEIVFSGENTDTLQHLANRAMDIIRAQGIAVEFLRTNWGPKVPVYVPVFSQQKGGRPGITHLQMAQGIRMGTTGLPLAEYRERDLSLPILLKDDAAGDASLAGLAELPVFDAAGHSVPMAQIVDRFDLSWQYNTLWHFQREKSIAVRMEPLRGGNTNALFGSVWALVRQKTALPPGYSLGYLGEQEPQDQANDSLKSRLPLAFLLMVIVLLLLFGNMRDSLAVISMLPLILIGVVGGLFALGKAFDFFALLGLLGLVGMNIKSAVILVHEIVRMRREEDKDPFEAVIHSAKNRLVPVTTGAAATIVGMAPLLGDAMFGGMAATIMGGLFMATILTMLVLPVAYCTIHNIKKK